MRVFITGANRGIGLEMTRQLTESGHTVFATARQPEHATELQAQDAVIIPLEVTDSDQIEAAARAVRQHTNALDVVVNNAGILNRDNNLDKLTFEESLHTMHVNAIAPVFVARAMLPLLREGENPRLVSITSQLGSLERKTSGGLYDYCASKAALNMYTRTLAADFKRHGIITVMVHPGWVQTDMGGSSATLTPQESARAILALVDTLSPEMNGGFYRQDGSVHPW